MARVGWLDSPMMRCERSYIAGQLELASLPYSSREAWDGFAGCVGGNIPARAACDYSLGQKALTGDNRYSRTALEVGWPALSK